MNGEFFLKAFASILQSLKLKSFELVKQKHKVRSIAAFKFKDFLSKIFAPSLAAIVQEAI